MKVTVHDILVNCSEHGKVPYQAISDIGGDTVIMQCPRCEAETHQQRTSTHKEKTDEQRRTR